MVVPILKAMRPHQWVKNLFVAAPLLFSKHMLEPKFVGLTATAMLLFCALSGAVYLINDIIDVEKDRAHPRKRHRPIASGLVSLSVARSVAALLIITALGLSWLIGVSFFACGTGYLILNLAYSLSLKHIPFVDVFSIATGFLIRVLAGALAIDVPASPWLLACTFVLACYLGFGKRIHELMSAESDDIANKQRPVLTRYQITHLKWILRFFAVATCVLYGIYTLSPNTVRYFGTHYLVFTTPFAIFGVFRFLKILSRDNAADSPTDAMLKDKLFVANFIVWGIAAIVVIYGI